MIACFDPRTELCNITIRFIFVMACTLYDRMNIMVDQRNMNVFPWWSHAGKGLTSLLSFVSNFDVVTFPSVSWVRCGA